MLGKLYINSNSNTEILKAVKVTAEEVGAGRLVADAASRNSLAKLVTAVEKALAIHGDVDDGKNLGRRSKSKSASEEVREEEEVGDDKVGGEQAENDDGAVVVKKESKSEELSVTFDELSILESSRIEDDGDTMMEM